MILVQKINYYIEKLKFLKRDCGKETVKIIDRQIDKFQLKSKDLENKDLNNERN